MVYFNNLLKYNEQYMANVHESIMRVSNSGYYILGEEVELFEAEFSDYLNVDSTVGVGNGFDALNLIIRALGFPPGSEIIVAANTYIATILPIIENGLTPVLVDADIATFNIDIGSIEGAISNKTKAILVTHLFGHAADIPKILKIANKYGIMLLEDCAQAHGAKDLANNLVGSTGYASAYSFYPTKNLGCLGDAGAVVSNDRGLVSEIRALRNYGSLQKGVNDHLGINSRMDEIQAAILRCKLPYLDADNKIRKKYARMYDEMIVNKNIVKPAVYSNGSQVWHQYTILTEKRDSLMEYLLDNCIQTDIHYKIPPYKQDPLRYLGEVGFPNSDILHDNILSLPISPEHTPEEIMFVCDKINGWML